jgi:hypothetical protein
MTTRPDSHPDADELEAFRTGEASDDVRRHVEACATCRESVAGLEAIASRLAGSTGTTEPVPEATETAVVRSLFAEAKRIRRARSPRILKFAAIAAASLLLIVGLWPVLFAVQVGDAEKRPRDPMDVDRNGTVDIVDAYLVARRIRRHEETPDRFDVNGDGAVDTRDVDELARAAVSLERGLR